MTKKQSQVSLPTGIGIGVGFGIVVSILGAMAGAWLIGSERIGEGSIQSAAYTVIGLSAGLGCWAAVSAVGSKRMQVSMLTGLGYYLSMLAITALFFEGEFEDMMIPAAIVGAGSLIIGLLSAGAKKKQKTRSSKRAFC